MGIDGEAVPGILSYMRQLHDSSSSPVCAQKVWLHILFSVFGFGRDEVMIGAIQQGPFPWREDLGAEAVAELRQKRKAHEVD